MKKTLKIAHLSSAHPDKDVRIFYKECASLANNFPLEGVQVEVHLVLSGVEERVDQNVHIHSVLHHGGSRFKRMWSTVNDVYRKAVELDADIYHFHDPELLRIGIKLEKRGKKVIYDVHEDVPKQIMDKQWIPHFFRSAISKLFKYYEERAAGKLSGVVTVTPIINQRFEKVNRNVQMVANYPLKEETKKIHALKTKRIKNQVCYVGGLFPTRGIKELVQAMELTSCNLILAGTFSSPDFESEVRSLKGWRRVKYLGQIDRDEIYEVLSSSSVGVVTLHPTRSYVESLPIKMFEYMSAGIPFVASDFPMWREMLHSDKCGVFANPLIPEDIAEKIIELVSDEKLALEMGANGFNAFEQKFNWGVEEKKLFKIYEDLLIKNK